MRLHYHKDAETHTIIPTVSIKVFCINQALQTYLAGLLGIFSSKRPVTLSRKYMNKDDYWRYRNINIGRPYYDFEPGNPPAKPVRYCTKRVFAVGRYFLRQHVQCLPLQNFIDS